MCLGIPGQIVAIGDAAQQRATVDVDGVRQEVSVAMLDLGGPEGVQTGDWVVVHVGFAMARIDEREARETLEAIHELSDMYMRELGEHAESAEAAEDPRPG